MYHFDADAAEHLHHKGNATLQSQVRNFPAWTLPPLTAVQLTENVKLLKSTCTLRKSMLLLNISNAVLSVFIEFGKLRPCFNVKVFYNSNFTQFKTYGI